VESAIRPDGDACRRVALRDVFGYGPRSAAMAGRGRVVGRLRGRVTRNPALISRIHLKTLVVGYQGAVFDLHANGPGLRAASPTTPPRASSSASVCRCLWAASSRIASASPSTSTRRPPYREREDPLSRGPPVSGLPDRTQSLAIRAGLGLDSATASASAAGLPRWRSSKGASSSRPIRPGTSGRTSRTSSSPCMRRRRASRTTFRSARATLSASASATGASSRRASRSRSTRRSSRPEHPRAQHRGRRAVRPAEVAFEAAYDTKPMTVSVGATYKNWSRYPARSNPRSRAKPPCRCAGRWSRRWCPFTTRIVPRAGVERTLPLGDQARIHLRAGYAFEPTPSPDSTPSSQAYDTRRHGSHQRPDALLRRPRATSSRSGVASRFRRSRSTRSVRSTC